MASVYFIFLFLLAGSTSVATSLVETCDGQITNVDISFESEEDLRNQLTEHFISLLTRNPRLLHSEVTIQTELAHILGNTESKTESPHNSTTGNLTTTPKHVGSTGKVETADSSKILPTSDKLTVSPLFSAVDDTETKFVTSGVTSNFETSTYFTTTSVALTTLSECDFTFDGKCFKIVNPEPNYKSNFDKAKSLCKSCSMSMGNIYSLEHYNKIQKYIRDYILNSGSIGNLFLWTGMRYRNKEILQTSGTKSKLSNWHINWPNTEKHYENIVICVDRNANEEKQGILNYLPTKTSVNGALCERSMVGDDVE
ncbi:uncharacterized protein LOC144425732 [Styela clava]